MKNETKGGTKEEAAHYLRIYKLAIHSLMEAFLNGDKRFANIIKAVWLQSITESKEKGIDVAMHGMPDFTSCDDAQSLSFWKLRNGVAILHHMDAVFRAEEERFKPTEGESLMEHKNALEAITEGQKEGDTIVPEAKRSFVRSKVMRSKKKVIKGGKKK